MNKTIVWTAAAVAAIGLGVPVFAAITSPSPVRQIAPTPVVSVAEPDWTTTIDVSTTTVSVTSAPATIPTISVTANSIEVAPDTSTESTVEELRVTETSDNSGSDDSDNSGRGSNNSGHGSDNSGEDNSGHGGGDD